MQPVHRLQIHQIVHNLRASSTTPPSYIRVRAVVWAYGRGQTDIQTDRQTHRRASQQYILHRLRLTQNVKSKKTALLLQMYHKTTKTGNSNQQLYWPITTECDGTALTFTEYTEFCNGRTNDTGKHEIRSTF